MWLTYNLHSAPAFVSHYEFWSIDDWGLAAGHKILSIPSG